MKPLSAGSPILRFFWPDHLGRMIIYGLVLSFFSVTFAFAESTENEAANDIDTLQAIEDRGAFLIGSDIPYGVMEFFDEAGNPTGIDIEIARRVAEELGATLDVKNIPFDQLFDALDAGEIDAVVSAVTITQERQEKMLFSVPYMDTGMTIAVAESNSVINSEEDLTGQKVGVLKGTVGEDLMRKSRFVEPEKLTLYEDNEERLSDLRAGKLDAVVVHFASDSVPGLRLLEPPLTQSFYGIVVRLKDEELMSSINTTLRDMKRSGELENIKRSFTDP